MRITTHVFLETAGLRCLIVFRERAKAEGLAEMKQVVATMSKTDTEAMRGSKRPGPSTKSGGFGTPLNLTSKRRCIDTSW